MNIIAKMRLNLFNASSFTNPFHLQQLLMKAEHSRTQVWTASSDNWPAKLEAAKRAAGKVNCESAEGDDGVRILAAICAWPSLQCRTEERLGNWASQRQKMYRQMKLSFINWKILQHTCKCTSKTRTFYWAVNTFNNSRFIKAHVQLEGHDTRYSSSRYPLLQDVAAPFCVWGLVVHKCRLWVTHRFFFQLE